MMTSHSFVEVALFRTELVEDVAVKVIIRSLHAYSPPASDIGGLLVFNEA
jgi:hypothetical protein